MKYDPRMALGRDRLILIGWWLYLFPATCLLLLPLGSILIGALQEPSGRSVESHSSIDITGALLGFAVLFATLAFHLYMLFHATRSYLRKLRDPRRHAGELPTAEKQIDQPHILWQCDACGTMNDPLFEGCPVCLRRAQGAPAEEVG